MWIKTANARMALNAQRATRLNRACGATLLGVQGMAWITIDNDRRDIVLGPGERFVVDSNANLLMFALRDSATIEVLAASAPARCAPAIGPRHKGLLRRLAARFAPRPALPVAAGA